MVGEVMVGEVMVGEVMVGEVMAGEVMGNNRFLGFALSQEQIVSRWRSYEG
jgi:hypothetical protein